MEISLAGIEQAVEGLGYRNDKSPKSRLVYTLKSHYLKTGSAETVSTVDTDALIDIMWGLGGNKKAIRSKRKNLSSIKSSVNADLNKAWEHGRNPEGITIGPLNTFVMSDSAKDKILNSFSGAMNLEGGNSLDRVTEALKIVSDYVSNLPGGLEDDKLSNLKSLVEGLADKFKDGGGPGEFEITRKTTDDTADIAGKTENEPKIKAADDEVLDDGLDVPEDLEIVDEEEVLEDAENEDALLEDVPEIEEIAEDDFVDTGASIEEDIIDDDSDAFESDDTEIIEVMDEDDMPDIPDEVELVDEEELLEEIEDSETLIEDDTELEEIIDEEPGDLEMVDEEDIIDDDSGTIESDDTEIIEVMDEDNTLDEIDEVEVMDEEDIVENIEDDETLVEDDTEIEEIIDEEPDDLEMVEEDTIDEDSETLEADDAEIIEETDEDDSLDETDQVEVMDEEEILENAEDNETLVEDDTEIEEIDEAELDDIDEVLGEDETDSEEEDVVEVMEEADVSEFDEADILEGEDVLEEVEEVEDEDLNDVIEPDDDTLKDDVGLPLDQLAEDDIDFDEFQPDEEQKRLLAERFDGYLGAMERFYNQYIIIKKGKYGIGSEETESDVLKKQKVSLPDYYMGKYPITNALFEVFIERTGYKTTAEKLGFGYVYQGRFQKTVDPKTGLSKSIWNPSFKKEKVNGATWYQPTGPGSTLHQKRNHPVVQISIRDARTFAAWTGKRLPTEIEWEAAARTRAGFIYPWGNEWQDNSCNWENSGFSDTCPVDSHPLGNNEPGLADLLGNVLEWTASECDPKYPMEKTARFFIAKGGSWVSHEKIRLFERSRFESEFTANILGFRCLAD